MLEKNKPYKAFNPEDVMTHDGMYYVPINSTRTLYDGRYCAVAGFIYAIVDGIYCVLANKRGKGTPDYQGYWNCPCGFLERGENSKEGISREVYEECNRIINSEDFKIVHVQTEPSECNNGNVTIHHTAFLGIAFQYEDDNITKKLIGEVDEVSEIKWIPVSEISKYEWAFGHERNIRQYAYPLWKQLFLKLIYKFF